MFISTTQTKLGYQDRGHTFNTLVILEDGSVCTSERSGGREVGKGLIVRYPNPFASAAAPEVLHEAKESLLKVAHGEGNTLYAVSSKKLHTNETGAWKASSIKTTTKDGYFVADVAYRDGEVWASDIHGFHRREGKLWVTVFSADSAMPTRMCNHGGHLYLSWRGGVAVWDADAQRFQPLSIAGVELHQPDVTAADGERVNLFSGRTLLQGTAAGFERVELEWPEGETNIDKAVVALGSTFIATYSGLFRLEGKKLVKVMQATGWIASACAGNDKVLWIANGTELNCTDGKEWKVVRRALDETTRH